MKYQDFLEGEDKIVYFSCLKYFRLRFLSAPPQLYEDVQAEIYTSILELAAFPYRYKIAAIKRRINNLMASVIISTPSLETEDEDIEIIAEDFVHEEEISVEVVEDFLRAKVTSKQKNSRHERYIKKMALVLVISARGGKSWSKIAEEVGTSPRNVKKILADIRKTAF